MKRILIIGDKGTGKTTFLNIFMEKQLTENPQPTLGLQAAAKTIEFEDRSFVNLQIWDTPGQQQYSQMAYPFYSNCRIFVLMIDVRSRLSVQSFPDWLQKIQQNNPNKHNNVLIVLNKIPRQVYSGINQECYNKKAFEQIYRIQLSDAAQNKFHIAIKQIDLIEQRDHFPKQKIYPYLKQLLQEQIVTEADQKQQIRCGQSVCNQIECLVM